MPCAQHNSRGLRTARHGTAAMWAMMWHHRNKWTVFRRLPRSHSAPSPSTRYARPVAAAAIARPHLPQVRRVGAPQRPPVGHD